MNARTALPVALSLVLTLVTGTLAVFAFSDGQTMTGVLLLVAALGAAYASVLEIRRRDAAARSREAVAEWPAERVRATVGRVDGEVGRVRALRRADPRLTLADAVALVRSVAP